jgi:hypothetical protein
LTSQTETGKVQTMKTKGSSNILATRIPNLKSRMTTKGISEAKLASKAGVCRQLIYHAKLGRRITLSLAGYIIIALESV